jgi:hypothetical protein
MLLILAIAAAELNLVGGVWGSPALAVLLIAIRAGIAIAYISSNFS